jgi:hypothetical protein
MIGGNRLSGPEIRSDFNPSGGASSGNPERPSS